MTPVLRSTSKKATRGPKAPATQPAPQKAARRRETAGERKARALLVLEELSREFPEARCALHHETPHQLLVATILSAQCTDARVNQVTPILFKKYPSIEAFARAELSELEKDVHSTGFFRMKSLAIKEMSQDVLTKHGGQVPHTMAELVQLRGVGRKTANVVLGNVFGIPGVVVDTHVGRLSRLLGFTREKDPVKVERDLVALWPEKWWTLGSHLLILHGRKTCPARKPLCGACPVQKLCPSAALL